MNFKMRRYGFFGMIKKIWLTQSGRGLPQSGTLARRSSGLVVACFFGVLSALCIGAGVARAAEESRKIVPMDSGWEFFQDDPAGAEARDFDDAKWHRVDLPHDWSIAGPFAATNKTGGAGAFLPSGVAWYRTHFTMPTNDSGRHLWIEFDGVMQNSKVWINGKLLGERPYGYSSFRYDLTPYLIFGGEDVFHMERLTSSRCDAILRRNRRRAGIPARAFTGTCGW